jgi:hypothetical protein
MTRSILPVVALTSLALAAGWSSDARAQYVTVFRPVTPVTTFFAPAPAVVPAVQQTFMPVVSQPVVQAVAPQPWVAASPVVVQAASPVVVTPQPVIAAPAPVVTYFRAPVVTVAPVPQVVTRWRPILGGTVSRVRTTYMPVAF